MKERPILFNDAMVLAILDGRKKQTRRAVKPAYVNDNGYRLHEVVHGEAARKLTGPNDRAYVGFGHPSSCSPSYFGCHYGQPGDRLWVRECWAVNDVGHPVFRADGCEGFRWTPSIHMPRWASRITLEVTGVRVERLQAISEADAKAEGLKGITKDGSMVKYGIPDSDGFPGTDDDGWPWNHWRTDPRLAFRQLWESISGAESWDANPWVWVVEFRRLP